MDDGWAWRQPDVDRRGRGGFLPVFVTLVSLALLTVWGAQQELRSDTGADSQPEFYQLSRISPSLLQSLTSILHRDLKRPAPAPPRLTPDAAVTALTPPAAKTDPLTYREELEAIQATRIRLGRQYLQATSDSARERILTAARDSMFHAVTRGVIPFWYGTPWSYQGTTEVPRSGAIACGYFVTTVLRDAGLRINRIWLAQQASEVMIKALVSADHIKRFSYVPIASFIAAIQDWGPGLYVVGLDMHTGFIVNDGQDVFFIHSSPQVSYSVVCEQARQSLVLTQSRYRVVGKLSESDHLAQRWLRGDSFSDHPL